MAELTSRVWKSALLFGSSATFPTLVRGAAAWEKVPYTEDLVEYVATRPEVVDAVPIGQEVDGQVLDADDSLRNIGETQGEAMDAVLRAAVATYQVPTDA